MGSKGGGSSGAASTTVSNQPPQAILDAYSNLIKRGTDVSNQPYTPYTGQTVADLTPLQQQGIQGVANSAGVAQPYINQAAGLANQSATSIAGNIPQYNAQNLQQYQDPYTQSVINATQANLNQNNAVQQQQLLGKSIQSGASPFGGDRAGVAAAELSREQNLANNQTIAGLQSQGFQNAQQEFNNQQQTQLQAQNADAARQAQASYLLGGLGTSAQGAAMQGGLAQLQAGTVQQQQNQAQLNVPYQQYLQQQAYPFSTTQFLGNLVEGIGSNSGGTSVTTPPAPNQVSQGLGGILTGAGIGSALSGGSSNGTMMGAGVGGLLSYFKDGGSVNKYADGGEITTIIPWITDDKLPIGHTIPQGMPSSGASSGLSSVGNIGSLLSLASSFGGSMGGSSGSSSGSYAAAGSDMPWLNGTGAADGGSSGISTMPWLDTAATAAEAAKRGGGIGKYADGGSMPYSNPDVPNYGYIDPVSRQWVPKDNTSLFTPIATGSSSSSSTSSKPKKGGWGGAASGAMTGASIGTEISPGYGTAIGGVLGGIAGYFLKDGGVAKYADGGADDSDSSDNSGSFEMASEDIPYIGTTQNEATSDIQSQLDDKPTIDHSGSTTKIIYPNESDTSKRELDLGLPSPKGNIPVADTSHTHVKDNNNNYAIPLLAAGLGMLGGTSPYAGVNIAKGGEAGLQAYAQQQAVQRQQAQQEIVNRRAEQQQQYLQKKDQETQDYRNQILAINKEKVQQGKFSMLPGVGQDEKGNQVQGTYVYNSKTGESEFRPGMVTGKGTATAGKNDPMQKLRDESNAQYEAARGAADLSNAFMGQIKQAPRTGVLSPVEQWAGSALGQITGNQKASDTATALDTAQKLGVQTAFEKMGQIKGSRPGIGMLRLAAKGGPEITKTPEANQNITDLAQTTANGAAEQAKLVNNWQGSAADANNVLDEYFRDNPHIIVDKNGIDRPNLSAQPIDKWLEQKKGIDITGKPIQPLSSTPQQTQGESHPTVTSKQQFDALASGAIYTGTDGKLYRKP